MSELGMLGLVPFLFILGSAFKNLLYLKKIYWHSRFDTLPNVVISFLLFTFLMAMTSGNITNLALFALVGTAYSIENMIKKESREIECVSG
jgi:ABC-type transport system involved in cytochrome c biogenesis permease component